MIKSNEATIEQMNEAIALFEGRKRAVVNERGKAHHFWSDPTGTNPLYSETLHYHESWDELMPVVEKIENLFKGSLQVTIKDVRCYIVVDTQASLAYDIELPEDFYSGFCENKIKAVYSTVYQFIQWYNNQTTTNE